MDSRVYPSDDSAKNIETAFLASRLAYLAELPKLPAGWISNGVDSTGKAPTQDVCARAAQMLIHLARMGTPLQANLLISPLATGGVGIELLIGSLGFYLSLPNSGLCSVDFQLSDASWENSELPLNSAIILFCFRVLSAQRSV